MKNYASDRMGNDMSYCIKMLAGSRQWGEPQWGVFPPGRINPISVCNSKEDAYETATKFAHSDKIDVIDTVVNAGAKWTEVTIRTIKRPKIHLRAITPIHMRVRRDKIRHHVCIEYAPLNIFVAEETREGLIKEFGDSICLLWKELVWKICFPGKEFNLTEKAKELRKILMENFEEVAPSKGININEKK